MPLSYIHSGSFASHPTMPVGFSPGDTLLYLELFGTVAPPGWALLCESVGGISFGTGGARLYARRAQAGDTAPTSDGIGQVACYRGGVFPVTGWKGEWSSSPSLSPPEFFDWPTFDAVSAQQLIAVVVTEENVTAISGYGIDNQDDGISGGTAYFATWAHTPAAVSGNQTPEITISSNIGTGIFGAVAGVAGAIASGLSMFM